MTRLFLLSVAVGGMMALNSSMAIAETVDQRIKNAVDAGTIKIVIQDHTRDACDRGNDITITSATDPNVVVRPGKTTYFKINKDKGDYERSGGWRWKCGDSEERARIKGATYIKVIRNERGVTDWYWVLIELKD